MTFDILLFAQQNDGPPWWFYPFIGLIGVVMIAIGSYGIIKRRAVVGRRQMAMLRLFGIQEPTGKAALVIGGGQCFAGVLALSLVVVGPFIAGSLKPEPNGANSGAGLVAQPPAASPNTNPVAQPPNSIASTAAPEATGQPDVANQQPADDKAPGKMRAGSESGKPFEDQAPEGGLLVGLRGGKGKNWGGALQNVQPIYQVGTGYAVGKVLGPPGGEEEQFLAKPGYAVGAMNARAGLVMNAVQLVFYRINGERLDPSDRYEGPWYGCDGGGPYQLDGKGAPFTALFGTSEQDVISIGVVPVEKLKAAIPLPTEPAPDLANEPRPSVLLGSTNGTSITDTAPDGGILVGVRAFCDSKPRPTLRSLQAIYLHGDRYVEGRRHGDGGSEEVLAVARPGFAVSGIGMTVGGDVCGLRLKFKKCIPGHEQPAEPEYESGWLGHIFHRPDFETSIGNRVAVGLISYCDSQPRGLALMLRGLSSVQVTQPKLPKEYQLAAYARPALRAGRESGTTFRDMAPDDGLLVGMRLAKGKNWGGALQAVQPIYQVETAYAFGQRHGKAGGDEVEVIAKPGYALGAIHARAGLVLNAIQLSFFRIEGLRLNPSDHYESAWIGSEGGGPTELDGHGDPITGIFGTYQDDLISIGVLPTHSLLNPVPLARGKPSRTKTSKQPASSEFRTWTSANGKSKVEAKMLDKSTDRVRLERRDGKVITVPLSQLSAADVEYVKSLE